MMPAVLAVLVLFGVMGLGLGLNADGVALVSLKHAALSDPLSVLGGWNENDASPCGWNGVVCAQVAGENESRVVGLVLPAAKLLSSIPDQLGSVQHLRHLDLSRNLVNGTIPPSLFNATELRILALADNELSGGIPENIGALQKLQCVNLSFNALSGAIPPSLTSAPALRFLSLSNNYFSGEIPPGFGKSQPLEALDLSSNLLNGSVTSEIDGVQYLNLSSNRLTGQISPEIGRRVPANATLDLSYNNLSGPVPEIGALLYQKPQCFVGNPDLCGSPVKTVCNIPSTPSDPPNDTTTTTSPPAIAAIPGLLPQQPTDNENSQPGNETKPDDPRPRRNGVSLAPGTIAGIVVGNFVALSFVFMIFIYRYQVRKKKADGSTTTGNDVAKKEDENERRCWWLPAGKKKDDENESVSEENSSTSDSYRDEQKPGRLVMVDSEPGEQLEVERLLKASAYILGANGTTIVYKAVLEDGTILAVRRIGESAVYRMKDFENRVRTIAKLRHPNLARIRGFYWGTDEKLIIYDYAPSGSLATFSRKPSSSPIHLKWEIRLRIGQGVARGLAYLHEKKYVHGNLKPSNVLLGKDMEPQIGDLGLDRLVHGRGGSSSAIYFGIGGSTRSTLSRDSLPPETSPVPPLSSSSPLGASANHVSPYQAPEALRTLKPTPKWDVYSYGVLLLELITGRPVCESELDQGPPEERNRALRMVDPGLRTEVEENEEMLLVCLRLGFACVSPNPQKRPAMKEVVQVLGRVPTASSFLRLSSFPSH